MDSAMAVHPGDYSVQSECNRVCTVMFDLPKQLCHCVATLGIDACHQSSNLVAQV